jgi:uncharacterized membrane protein
MTAAPEAELFEANRLLAFSDGVFGVAITLLVIDLRLPAIVLGSDDAAFLRALSGMGQKLFVFAFTFLIVGMSWMGHHRKFSYIDRVDAPLLWLNLTYLLSLCLVPFASSALAEHGSNRFAFALYASVMALTDLLSAGLSSYGLRLPFLRTGTELPSRLRRDMLLSPLLAGALFVVGAVIALLGWIRLAHWTLLLIVPAMAVLGSRTRRHASPRKS